MFSKLYGYGLIWIRQNDEFGLGRDICVQIRYLILTRVVSQT